MPRQSERADVILVDFFEWAESLFAVIAPMAHPISRLTVGADNPGAVHVRRFYSFRVRILSRPRDARIQNRQSKYHHDDSNSGTTHIGSLPFVWLFPFIEDLMRR